MKVLIIEDEQELLNEIRAYLTDDDFLCETVTTFDSAAEKIALYEYDVAVVDITLPGGSGLELIEQLKARCTNTGIIIISAKNSLDDKLTGLDLGADDYLTKPFHLAELNSRIKSVVRRRKFNGQNTIVFNDMVITPETNQFTVAGKPVMLTKKEFELLLFFIGNKNRVLTKESIAEHLWGDNIDLADNFDFIYTHINNLRKKIEKAGGKDHLKTIYGMGYKLASS